MSDTISPNLYRGINLREHPEKYMVGKHGQHVLSAEPYASEILPFWHFADPAAAQTSADKILALFYGYKKNHDFVGMDIARKFLQLGISRLNEQADHSVDEIYASDGTILAEFIDELTPQKSQSARIFRKVYDTIRNDPYYQDLRKDHIVKQG